MVFELKAATARPVTSRFELLGEGRYPRSDLLESALQRLGFTRPGGDFFAHHASSIDFVGVGISPLQRTFGLMIDT
jgi:hypothetical protein